MKPDNILVGHYAGSLAYGTNLPTSDVDIRGIFLDKQEEIWTPWSEPRMEEWEDKTQEDTKYTELYKYMIGYVNGSPNVMETLWVDESSIISSSDAYEYLRSMAPKLLSKRLRYSFGGYALGQLKKIKGHNKWINNPKPEKPPVRPDYFKLIQNFQEEKLFARDFNIRDYNEGHILVPYGNDIFGVVVSPEYTLFHYNEHIRKVDYSSIPDELKKATPKFIVKLNEDVFKTDQEQHAQYWTWKKNRNETRSLLEEQFGMDTKDAMHVVRLMRMCKEVLTDGVINVKRPDAEELLEIRGGKWKYEELLEWAEENDKELNKLVKKSDLPDKVDLNLAKEVLIKAEEIANATK